MSGNYFQEAGRTNNQANNDKEIPNSAAGSAPEEIIQANEGKKETDWLGIARDAYETSDSYFESSIRDKVERNLAHFSGRHAKGSKYYSDAYKHRAKGFRPKTRSIIRRNEAKGAIAMFATSDIVNVAAENDSIPEQVVSAEINQALLKYRLDNTVNWFPICMGAYQDTLNSGVVISHQSWDFTEAKEEETLLDERGESVLDNETGEDAIGIKRTIIKDTPRVELRPIENVRFSPSSDWEDVMGSTPYIVDQIPMEIGEIKLKMLQSEKSNVKWIELDDSQLRVGGVDTYNSVRSTREANREDSTDQRHRTTDFDTVWIHRNIIRKDGIDWLYYTVGVHHLLSEPVKLITEYPHLKPGQRPYVLGVSVVESHKIYPESLAGMTSNLQQEANDINNQRRDNVQLAMNRRYFAKKGMSTDYRMLTRSVPGSVTEVDNINDIRSEAPIDVTGSAYQEQDRINMDFDELAGAFSPGSVGSNRALNETVGGMEMISADADDITEYQLRTFVTTWATPVLKQLVQLEQYYESNEGLLKNIGDKLELWQRYNVDRITDMMLQGSMTVNVNVGFGSTNPKQRIDKLTLGLNTVLNFSPKMQHRVNDQEVANEVFGALGYDSADRFFLPDDPENQPEQQEDPRIAVAKIKAQTEEMRLQLEEGKHMTTQQFEQMKFMKDTELRGLQMEMTMQLKMMERQGTSSEVMEGIKADFAKLVMQIKSTERLVAAKARADQLPRPKVEPPGRAKAGESMSA